MTIRSSPAVTGRLRRVALLLVILVVHALLVLWFAMLSRSERIARPVDDGLITISLAGSGGATVRPRNEPARARAASVKPITVAASPMQPQLDPSAAADAGAGAGSTIGGCALAHDAGQAIAQDPLAMAELDALPAGMRSSADAVMLWNGQWLSDGPMPPAIAGGALRRAVEKVVAGAASDCRDAQITGPQFVPVLDADRTVMIVIGSGIWRWADLAAPPACADAGGADCPVIAKHEPDE